MARCIIKVAAVMAIAPGSPRLSDHHWCWELCKGIDYNLQEKEGTADCASECQRWRGCNRAGAACIVRSEGRVESSLLRQSIGTGWRLIFFCNRHIADNNNELYFLK